MTHPKKSKSWTEDWGWCITLDSLGSSCISSYMFIIRQGYFDTEKTNGLVISKIIAPPDKAPDVKAKVPWDISDFSTNPGEQGAVFLPTRILTTRGQVQDGYCGSPLHLCKSSADCNVGGAAKSLQKPECSSGKCMRRQWCP